jgi:putative addiction module component (TIGR02574 family)
LTPTLVPNPPPGFDDLSVEEKIDYVQSLWERIAARPDQVPVPGWHSQILKERLKAYRDDLNRGRPWAEVREDLERKLGPESSGS